MRPERYVPKKISEIKLGDSRVSIIGKVAESKNSSFIVDDESGTAEIFSEKIPEAGSTVRAFCNFSDGTLKADVVQSLNGFDINLYHKVQDLYRKVGV
jgi:predicted dinucleotide-binding enzyme